jgi:predicted metal-dependent phosphoesterase TrpH
MSRTIDLHTHSTASDGSFSPGELVKHAWEKGLSAVALTDHDTVAGVDEAVEQGKKLGIEVIGGIEIGIEFKPEMHMLGYFLNKSHKKISKVIDRLFQSREERNPKIIAKLNEMGFDITMDDVKRNAGGNIVGRPHIAKALVDKGYVNSTHEAFEKYLASGKPAYFPKDKLSPSEGIGEILEAGGIPVLAHPIFLGLDYAALDDLLGELTKSGLKGIEVYYTENSYEDTGNLLGLAMKHKPIVTGGSDFHGRFKPDIDIGTGRGNLHVPYELLEGMRKALNS